MSCTRLKRLVLGVGAAVILLSEATYSQHVAYQTIENWFKLPEGRKIGSTAGITVDRDGTMKVPVGPGIGVTVLEDVIRKLALQTKEYRPQ